MIQAEVEKKPLITTTCLHIHHFKPLIACGLSNGFLISNYQSQGKVILELKEQRYSPTKIMFLESYQALATIGFNQATKETTLYIWKLKISNQKAQDGNQIVLSSKSDLKFQPFNFKFNQEVLALVSLNKIYLFSVARLEIVHIIDVVNNTRGLLSFSFLNHPGKAVIPDQSLGVVKVFSLFNYKKSNPIQAHKTQIANIAITPNGTRIATSSVKLTSLRIFSSSTLEKIGEIKLSGIKNPTLNIQFSLHSDWMIVCTKDGSFSVFVSQLSKEEKSEKVIQLQNPKSTFYVLSSMFRQFSKDLPFAESQSKLSRKVSQCLVRLDTKNDIVMVYTDALSQHNHVQFIRFDPINGGYCSVKKQITLKSQIEIKPQIVQE